MPFEDRRDAGRALAACLADLAATEPLGPDPVVLGLPRGGVVVAAEVADRLGAPLDIILVRKLGVPGQPELALGALGEGGARVVDEHMVRRCGLGPDGLAALERRAQAEMANQGARYRHGPPVALAGRMAVVVDDGVATGATATAACQVARATGAAAVILAVPVASPDSIRRLEAVADRVVCVERPTHLMAVGQVYWDFAQVDDDEVVARLRAGPDR
jgi:predicted phosphoribosyltransferase